MTKDPNTRQWTEGELPKMLVILDVLRSVEPAAMDFKYFFPGEGELVREKQIGILQLLEHNGYVKASSVPWHYSITEEGKRFIARVPEESLRKIPLEIDETNNVVVSIQPSSWPHREEALWLPMIRDFGKLKNDLPVITFGYNRPDVIENMPLTEKNKNLIPGLLELAIKNLRKNELSIKEDLEAGLVFVTGHYFAAERILDVEFMKPFHEKLKSDILIASIPKKGYLFITRSFNSVGDMNAFRLITRMEYTREAEQIALSETLFTIMEGKICGIMNPEF